MALRPLAFGIRLTEKGRSVRVRNQDRDPSGYVVEDSRRGQKTRRREHSSLAGALKDAASTWRMRLN